MEPFSEDNDRSLVLRMTAGDADAAESFDARFRPRLLRFAQSRNIPLQDQGDLVQDVLTAAIQKFREDGFHEESSLGTWLLGILNHKIADYWERCSRERARFVQIEGGPATAIHSMLEKMADPTPHPAVAVEVS